MVAISNLVKQLATSNGNGNFTLTNAAGGFQTFATAFGTGATPDIFYYFISHTTNSEWEVGTGHMSNTNTLVRDTVIASSNANSKVVFTSGTKIVVNDLPASIQASGGVPSTITVANEATDTTCYLGFFTAATGDLQPKTHPAMRWDAAAGSLTINGTVTNPAAHAEVVAAVITYGPYSPVEFYDAYENFDPYSYTTGDTIQYRIYSRYLVGGNYFYSATYYEPPLVTITAGASSVYVQWDPDLNPDGLTLDYLVLRDFNSSGFIWWQIKTSGAGGLIDGNGGGGDFAWSNVGVPTPSPTTGDLARSVKFCYTDGGTEYGVHTDLPAHFDETVTTTAQIGIHQTVPTAWIDINAIAGGGGIGLKIRTTEHSSAGSNDFTIVDSGGNEVFGAAAWNGGGGTGGYGANVLSSYCTGSGQRMGEMGGKNSFNGYRLVDWVFETGSASDNGRAILLVGTGGGSFGYAMYADHLTNVGLSGISAPTDRVHIGAGSTSYAPLRLTSASLPTGGNIRAGQVCFLTDKYYATITTGTAQKEFTLNDIALTAGRVPFVVNGRLTDDADMAFATDTLTVTKVSVKNGASSGVAKVGGVIFDHYADTGNVGTGEDDLYSDTLPASTFGANGDKVEARYIIALVSSATATRQVRAYIGGTKVLDSTALTLASGGTAEVKITAIRESSTALRVMAEFIVNGITSQPVITYTNVTGLTLTNTQILKITGEAAGAGAATNDLVAKLSTTIFYPAA
jgi:hypothetical protein